jgi:prophage maintenance system killer protein
VAPIVIDLGRLEFIVDGQYRKVFGFDPWPSVYDKAAYLLCNLSFYHCFFAGNKRTAWEASRVFLRANDIGIYYNCEDTVRICFDVATLRDTVPVDEYVDEALELKIAETSQWIKRRSFSMSV